MRLEAKTVLLMGSIFAFGACAKKKEDKKEPDVVSPAVGTPAEELEITEAEVKKELPATAKLLENNKPAFQASVESAAKSSKKDGSENISQAYIKYYTDLLVLADDFGATAMQTYLDAVRIKGIVLDTSSSALDTVAKNKKALEIADKVGAAAMQAYIDVTDFSSTELKANDERMKKAGDVVGEVATQAYIDATGFSAEVVKNVGNNVKNGAVSLGTKVSNVASSAYAKTTSYLASWFW